jgi:hypothetical protein
MAALGKVRAYIVFMMQMDINIRGDICDIDYSLMAETANKNIYKLLERS